MVCTRRLSSLASMSTPTNPNPSYPQPSTRLTFSNGSLVVSEDKLPNETVKEHDVEHKDIKHDHAVKEHEEHEHDSRETIERQRQQQDCITKMTRMKTFVVSLVKSVLLPNFRRSTFVSTSFEITRKSMYYSLWIRSFSSPLNIVALAIALFRIFQIGFSCHIGFCMLRI